MDQLVSDLTPAAFPEPKNSRLSVKILSSGLLVVEYADTASFVIAAPSSSTEINVRLQGQLLHRVWQYPYVIQLCKEKSTGVFRLVLYQITSQTSFTYTWTEGSVIALFAHQDYILLVTRDGQFHKKKYTMFDSKPPLVRKAMERLVSPLVYDLCALEGDQLLLGSAKELQVFDLLTGTCQFSVKTATLPFTLTCLKSSVLVAFSDKITAWILNRTKGSATFIEMPVKGELTAMIVAGNYVLCGDTEGGVHSYSLDTGQKISSLRLGNTTGSNSKPAKKKKKLKRVSPDTVVSLSFHKDNLFVSLSFGKFVVLKLHLGVLSPDPHYERVFPDPITAHEFDSMSSTAYVLTLRKNEPSFHFWVPELKISAPKVRIFKIKLPDGNFSSVPFQPQKLLKEVLASVLKKNPHLDPKLLGEPSLVSGEVIDRNSKLSEIGSDIVHWGSNEKSWTLSQDTHSLDAIIAAEMDIQSENVFTLFLPMGQKSVQIYNDKKTIGDVLRRLFNMRPDLQEVDRYQAQDLRGHAVTDDTLLSSLEHRALCFGTDIIAWNDIVVAAAKGADETGESESSGESQASNTSQSLDHSTRRRRPNYKSKKTNRTSRKGITIMDENDPFSRAKSDGSRKKKHHTAKHLRQSRSAGDRFQHILKTPAKNEKSNIPRELTEIRWVDVDMPALSLPPVEVIPTVPSGEVIGPIVVREKAKVRWVEEEGHRTLTTSAMNRSGLLIFSEVSIYERGFHQFVDTMWISDGRQKGDSFDTGPLILAHRAYDRQVVVFSRLGSIQVKSPAATDPCGLICDLLNVPEASLDFYSINPNRVRRLSKEVVKFERKFLPSKHKFGVLTVPVGCTMEKEIYSCSTISPEFQSFVNCLGDPVDLLDFEGYNGGLDVTPTLLTGPTAIHARIENSSNTIMFHVAPMIPARGPADPIRKRHVGNDVLVLVFNESGAPFDVDLMRSHFTHIYVVVEPVYENDSPPLTPSTPSSHTDEDEFGPPVSPLTDSGRNKRSPSPSPPPSPTIPHARTSTSSTSRETTPMRSRTITPVSHPASASNAASPPPPPELAGHAITISVDSASSLSQSLHRSSSVPDEKDSGGGESFSQETASGEVDEGDVAATEVTEEVTTDGGAEDPHDQLETHAEASVEFLTGAAAAAAAGAASVLAAETTESVVVETGVSSSEEEKDIEESQGLHEVPQVPPITWTAADPPGKKPPGAAIPFWKIQIFRRHDIPSVPPLLPGNLIVKNDDLFPSWFRTKLLNLETSAICFSAGFIKQRSVARQGELEELVSKEIPHTQKLKRLRQPSRFPTLLSPRARDRSEHSSSDSSPRSVRELKRARKSVKYPRSLPDSEIRSVGNHRGRSLSGPTPNPALIFAKRRSIGSLNRRTSIAESTESSKNSRMMSQLSLPSSGEGQPPYDMNAMESARSDVDTERSERKLSHLHFSRGSRSSKNLKASDSQGSSDRNDSVHVVIGEDTSDYLSEEAVVLRSSTAPKSKRKRNRNLPKGRSSPALLPSLVPPVVLNDLSEEGSDSRSHQSSQSQ